MKDRDLVVAGFFDPSLETGATSDYKAFVTVGWDRQEMVFYVMDAFIQKATLDQTLRAIFNRHQEYGYQVLGVEDNLFQRLLLKEFDRLGQERGQISAPQRGDPPHRQGDPGGQPVAAAGAGQDPLHPGPFGPGAARRAVALSSRPGPCTTTGRTPWKGRYAWPRTCRRGRRSV